jgi:hypothetical protein
MGKTEIKTMQKGFTINKDGRVNLVISKNCYETLKKDIQKYEKTKEPEWNKSINILFEPILSVFFVDKIMLDSIKSYEQLKPYLNSSINENELVNAFKLNAIQKVKSELNTYKLARNSGNSLNIKFNIRNVSLIENYDYYYLFEGRSFSFFVRCLLEYYLKMTPIERERLYFKKIVDEINMRSTVNQSKMYRSDENRNMTFVPFEVRELQKKEMLVVIGLIIDSNGKKSVGVKILPEFNKYKDLGYQFYSLDSDEITIIKNQFENRDLTDYTVKFNNLGIDQYKNNPEGRPKTISTEDALVKIFKSRDDEMIAYFVKFGANVTILEPKDARDLFRNFFRFSLANYEKHSI